MDEKLLKIINHYGVSNQLKKFNEESYELIEAINEYEWVVDSRGRCNTAHIVEEMADVQVMILQFKEYYHIDDYEILKIMNEKINRQLKRIEEEK